MMLAKKTKAFILSFIFIISIFSVLSVPNIKAEENDDMDLSEFKGFLGGDFDFENNIFTQHPYRFVSAWRSNETRTIKGDIEFDLFFYSTMLSQLDFFDYEDEVKLSLHKVGQTMSSLELINETDFIKINTDLFEDSVQNTKMKIKNQNFELKEGEYLLFGIEINQVEKPISKRTEKNFREKVLPLFRRISGFLKTREENESQLAAEYIDLALDFVEDLDVEGKEIASLFNTLRSSIFYYGSNSCPSNVKFSSTNNETFNIYFRNEANYEFLSVHTGAINLVEGYFKNTNKTKPADDTNHYWPAITLNTIQGFLEGQEEFNMDLSNWAVLWAIYTLDEPPSENENLVELYLKNNKKMNTIEPEGEVIREKLPSDSSIVFTGPNISRNRIITNLSAELFIHYPKLITLRNLQIKASIVDLNDESKEIASDIKSIDRASLTELFLRGSNVATMFTFDDFSGDYEIEYDHKIGLEISVQKAGLLNLRPINLLYNSDFYRSKISYIYEETDNIQIDDIENKDTYAGGSAVFDVKITSEKDDTVNIDFKNTSVPAGSWNLKSVPQSFDIDKDTTKTIKVYINSTAEDISAYENKDVISSLIIASGKTGIDSEKVTVRVKKDKVPFDFEVEVPEEIEIKHGEKEKIKLKIKNMNKGFVVDSYFIEIDSENELYKNQTNVEDVPIYNDEPENEIVKEITISIPEYTEIKSDEIILKIESIEANNLGKNITKTIIIETKIITPNIFENIYHLFEKLSDKIGLDDHLGSYAAWTLIGLFILMILILVFISVIIIKRKFIQIICPERIKEITPDEKAEFEIELVNPYKRKLSYEIKTDSKEELKERWNISVSDDRIVLAAGQKETIKLEVSPTDYAKKDDWAKVDLIVTTIEKNKTQSIETATVLKESKKDVTISGVLHWPREFKKGDRVETSFKLFNKGTVSAEKLTIILFVNGKEKNKVEDVTIPRGGHADIEIPWIAEKGKNKIKIIVK